MPTGKKLTGSDRKQELRALAKAQCKQADQLVAGLLVQQSIETELELHEAIGPTDYVDVFEVPVLHSS